MNMYAESFMYKSIEVNFDLLARSLVEKTTILAKQMSIPYITKEHFTFLGHRPAEQVTKELLLDTVKEKLKEMEPSIEKDSLLLLQEELLNPSLQPALIKGLIENIRKHPHCKWIAFLFNEYYAKLYKTD